MPKFAKLLAALSLVFSSLSAANTPRYFKMDHGTGAMYIALAPDGSYAVTAREHMFVGVEESGRWSKSGSRIAFIPNRSDASPYSAEEVSYKGRIFLALEGDAGPSIAVPIAQIEESLDQNPKGLPPFAFFEVNGIVYEKETKQTYPFHTRPNAWYLREHRIYWAALAATALLIWRLERRRRNEH
jgi:hypothetical protein